MKSYIKTIGGEKKSNKYLKNLMILTLLAGLSQPIQAQSEKSDPITISCDAVDPFIEQKKETYKHHMTMDSTLNNAQEQMQKQIKKLQNMHDSLQKENASEEELLYILEQLERTQSMQRHTTETKNKLRNNMQSQNRQFIEKDTYLPPFNHQYINSNIKVNTPLGYMQSDSNKHKILWLEGLELFNIPTRVDLGCLHKNTSENFYDSLKESLGENINGESATIIITAIKEMQSALGEMDEKRLQAGMRIRNLQVKVIIQKNTADEHFGIENDNEYILKFIALTQPECNDKETKPLKNKH